MNKRLFLISCLLLIASSVAAADHPCLRYEPEVVELQGEIQREVSPGRPNYESIENGDEPEVYWVLLLPQVVCVSGNSKDQLNSETERDVKKIQLIITDYEKFRSIFGKNVFVKGELMHSFTGHHHTRVLLKVDSMTEGITSH